MIWRILAKSVVFCSLLLSVLRSQQKGELQKTEIGQSWVFWNSDGVKVWQTSL